MMEFEEFKKEVTEEVCRKQMASCAGLWVVKGFEYGHDFLTARKDDFILNDTPVVLFKNLYECYLGEEGPVRSYAKQAVEYFSMFYGNISDFVCSGREVLDKRVFFRAAGYRDRGLLDICPHIKAHGVDVIFGFLYNDMVDIAVTDGLMRKAGYTVRDLQALAWENTPALFPAKILDPRSLNHGGAADTVVISNRLGRYGASTLLYPGLIDKVAATFGDSPGIYVFPYGTDYIAVSPRHGDTGEWDDGDGSQLKIVPFPGPDRPHDKIFYYDTKGRRLLLARDADQDKRQDRGERWHSGGGHAPRRDAIKPAYKGSHRIIRGTANAGKRTERGRT